MSNLAEVGVGVTELKVAKGRSVESKLKGNEEVVGSGRGVPVVSHIHFGQLRLF